MFPILKKWGGIRNCLKLICFNKILKTGFNGWHHLMLSLENWEGQVAETLLIAFRSQTLISKVWGNQESVNSYSVSFNFPKYTDSFYHVISLTTFLVVLEYSLLCMSS